MSFAFPLPSPDDTDGQTTGEGKWFPRRFAVGGGGNGRGGDREVAVGGDQGQ